jgi:multimeric flavodoxin WrbA
MKAVIILGTLKDTIKKKELSHTNTLSDFFAAQLKKQAVEVEIIRLVDLYIAPGTCTDIGEEDEWPAVLQKMMDASIIIFATPIWWNNHSSEMQKAIERLDEIHDEILEGKVSKLADKVFGVIITGDSDGAQHIIAGLGNFANAIGMVMAPYATLSVLAKEHEKDNKITKEALMEKYEKEQTKTASTMAEQLVRMAKLLNA